MKKTKKKGKWATGWLTLVSRSAGLGLRAIRWTSSPVSHARQLNPKSRRPPHWTCSKQSATGREREPRKNHKQPGERERVEGQPRSRAN